MPISMIVIHFAEMTPPQKKKKKKKKKNAIGNKTTGT